MIQKVKLLKSTGKFYDFSAKGTGLDWHQNTFLFAPNAYGKSTLVNVFRSLRDNDPKIMRGRKTVNVQASPEAVIIIDGIDYRFNGARWTRACTAIKIFDFTFINTNILTQEIEHEHRKNIHLLIIGLQGGKLAQELAGLKNREKERRKQFDDLAAKITLPYFVYFQLDAFLNLPAGEEADVLERIRKLERDIKSKESEGQVRRLGNPNALSALSFDFASLKIVTVQNIAGVHEDAEKRVLAHIAKNFKDRTQAKDFIRRGLDLMQADCPFCGQDLKDAADLISAYRQHFDDTFRVYQQKLAEQLRSLTNWNLDNKLTELVSSYNANNTVIQQWESFIGETVMPNVASIVEGCRTKLVGQKAKLHAELEKKQKDPNADFDLSTIEELASQLAHLKVSVDGYNRAVTAFAARTKEFVANLVKSDVDSIRRDLAKQREIEKRFKPEWKRWATDYQKAKQDVENLANQKNVKQAELDEYTKTIFATYQKRINELLLIWALTLQSLG